jgi:thiamine-monophosphate kinase
MSADFGAEPQITAYSADDVVVVIGDLGLFWFVVLAVRNYLPLESGLKSALLRNVLTPLPKNRIGHEVAKRGILTACMDNSDGLYPSLAELAARNNVQVHASMDNCTFPPEVKLVCSKLNIDPVRLALGWGDWQLVGCVSPGRLKELEDLCAEFDTPVHAIGNVETGSGVTFSHLERNGPMATIDSERFAKDSWFTVGIDAYIRKLVEGELWTA